MVAVGTVAARPDRTVRMVMTASGVVAVTYGLARFGYGLYLPTFTADFALSRAGAGSIAAGSFAGYCLAALLAHHLVRRGRPRAALWGAAVLAGTGCAFVSGAWSSTSLACGVVGAGSGAGMASPALVAAVAATVRRDGADRAQAVVNSGTGVGVVVGAALVTLAPNGWRATWAGFAVAAIVVARATDRATAWPNARLSDSRPEFRTAIGAQLVLLRRPALAAMLAGAGSASVWTFGQDLLATSTGVPAAARTALWGVLGASAVLGAASGDAVRRLGLSTAWTSTATITAAASLALPQAEDSLLLAVLALAGFGGAYTALSGILIAWGNRLAPHTPAQATAILFVALAAGQAFGALTLALLATRVTLAADFTVAAGLLLASATIRPLRNPRSS